MTELEKYTDCRSGDKVRFDLVGGAIVFVFIGATTVVTLLLISWWVQ